MTKCLYCGVREASWDSEPPDPGYSDSCWRCFQHTGYRTHVHVGRFNEVQIKVHGYDPDHTWETLQVMIPIVDKATDEVIGYRCNRLCGYEERI